MHILKATCGISAVIYCLIMSSCTNDMLSDNILTDDEIAFRAWVDERPSSHASRSGVAGGFEYLGPETATSDLEQTLYVHTLINEDCLDNTQSRAAAIHTSDLKSFQVSAYAHDGNLTTPGGTARPNLIQNATVKEQNNELWGTANKHYWPSSYERVRFYAYANLPGTLTPTSNFTQLRYTVNTDVRRQNDIVAAVSDVATADYIASKQPVGMLFKHILTGIRLRTAKGDNTIANYTIKRIGFENVYGSGTFTLKEFSNDAAADRSAMWTLSQGTSMAVPTSFTIDFGTGKHVGSDQPITADEQTLMMIPQQLPEGARLVIALEDETGLEHQLIKTLSGADWGMGQMITYIISSNAILVEDVFELYEVTRSKATGPVVSETRLPDVYKYEAPYYNYNMYDSTEVSMTTHYRIRSYRKEYPTYIDGQPVGNIKITPLSYTMSGGTDWIRTAVNNHPDNEHSGDGAYYDMVVDAQKMTQEDPWTEKLLKKRHAGEVMPSYSLDKDGYYDLSKRYSKNDEGVEAEITTANCYIVSGWGKYKFPVVYGNSIRHSRINYEAFGGFKIKGKSGLAMSDYKFLEGDDNPFVNSQGDKISTLKDLGGKDFINPRVTNATQPTLIWADYPEIVEDIYTSLHSAPNSAASTDDEDVYIEGVGTIKMKYVYFELTQENIQQGNIMMGFVSGTDNDKVNWSWQIWITPFIPDNHDGLNDKANDILDEDDEMLPTATFNSSGQSFTLLPYNLGWCNRVHLKFGDKDRDCDYTFVQAQTGKVIKLTVHQISTEDIQHGNNVLFQWGRKDPLRGSYSFSKGDPMLKPFYDWNNRTKKVEQYKIKPDSTAKSIPEVLTSPQFVYGASKNLDNWCTTDYDNLWRIHSSNIPDDCVQETDGKTIYDPSPVGYMIASSDVFPEFLSVNSVVDAPVRGFASSGAYISLCGYRATDGELYGGGQEAYYHAADPLYMLYFNAKSNTATQQNLQRVISGAVRPRQDRRFITSE